jgi:hypothetical protein
MNDTTKQILTAVAASTAGAVAAVLITHYLTKKSTIESVATGKTPLPPGSTPTTTGDKPIVATPTGATSAGQAAASFAPMDVLTFNPRIPVQRSGDGGNRSVNEFPDAGT